MKATPRSTRDDHDWASEAIPWLANGTLGEADVRRLRAHAESCKDCQQDLQMEEQVARRIAARQTVDYAPQASLARMMKRLDRAAMFSPRGWFARRRGVVGEGRRSTAAYVIAAQAAAVAVLALALSWEAWSPQPKQAYVLAGAPAPSLPHLQVIFDDKTDAGQILAALARVNGRVIGGPSSAGVYLVAIEGGGDAVNFAARTLQDDPRVDFVAVVRAPPDR